MTDINQLIQSGSAHVWLYIPVAILLGALHGLEPGHSKTMMAAFIIAVRGTVWQAVLLGLSAAISHSLLIWLLAGLALHYGGQWNVEHTEPYFHLASAVMILALAVWMFIRTRHEVAEAHSHDHRDGHDHGHTHEHAASLVAAKTDEPDQWQAHSHAHTAAPRLLTGETVTQSGLILPAGMDAPTADAFTQRETRAAWRHAARHRARLAGGLHL
jgi:nickel/cobalt exporter